ncbi:carboxypeptidase-like regulatory domain-containing protein [Stieleria sp. JC731]|uniref:carboxypeptidase-like regulatory domain-containing protein n=1 Tax=Pirellulaceae TaxID=2691357 RepID=UPI001E56D6C6|nr:carboxypeptidase-like regulatory domain-containing protein [Stieleria sp. JC731]MCC9603427.1 carboxypeptidase-like regulatory domain-containing protein [Stieleria sp. JC731]
MAIASIAILLVGLLVWLLFPPFFARQTQLVLIRADHAASIDVPVVPFAEQDLRSLQSVDGWNVSDWSSLWKSTSSANQLGDRFAGQQLRSDDTLVVCIAAHGISSASGPVLLCNDFSLRRQSSGRIAVEELLDQIRRSSAGTKILVVYDAGIEFDPRLGVVSNRFASQLSDVVEKTNDPSLWVYCSHGRNQHSFVEDAANQSVFGMFFTAAAGGAADLDQDRQLTLHELERFTSANVAKWTNSGSSDDCFQSPMLLWGGDQRQQPNPVVLSIDPSKEPQSWSTAELLNQKHKDSGSSVLASETFANNASSPGVINRLASTSTNNAQAAPPKTESQDGTPASSDQSSTDKPAKLASANSDAALLYSAWQLLDRLTDPSGQNAIEPNGSVALATRPHLLRELQREVLLMERYVLFGSQSQQEIGRERISRLVDSVTTDVSKNRQNPQAIKIADAVFPQSGTQRADGLLAEIDTDDLGLGLLIGELLDNPIKIDLSGLDVALRRSDRQAFEVWINTKWIPECEQYRQLRWIKSLGQQKELAWETLQSAARSALLGSRVAALDLIHNGWCRERVELADADHLFAAELLANHVGADWQTRAASLFDKARAKYEAAQKHTDNLAQLEYRFEKAISQIPIYLSMLTKIEDEDYRNNAIELVEILIKTTKEAADTLVHSDTSDLETSRSRLTALDLALNQAGKLLGDASARQLIDGAADLNTAHLARILLSSPLLNASLRMQLHSVVHSESSQKLRTYGLADLTVPASGDQQDEVSCVCGVEQARAMANLFTEYSELVNLTSGNPSGMIQKSLDAIQQSLAQITNSEATNQEDFSALVTTFEQAGVSFYESLVRDLLNSTSTDQVPQQLRSLRMLDGRDAWRFASIDTTTLSLPKRIQSTQSWLARRRWQRETFQDLNDAARSDTVVAALDQNDRPISLPLVKSVQQVDLQYQNQSKITLQIANPSDRPMSLILSVDVDRMLVDLSSPESAGHDSTEPEFQWSTASTEFGTRQSKPFQLKAHEKRDLVFNVHRNGLASESTELTFDFFATNPTELAIDSTTLLARHIIDVRMPVAELLIRHGDQDASSSESGLEIRPFPNRVQDLQFGLIGQTNAQKSVELNCFAIGKPIADSDWLDHASDYVGAPLFAAKYAMSTDGAPCFAGPAEGAAPEAEKPADEKASPVPSQQIPHGMIAVIKDLSTGQSTFRLVDFAIQRPRRFLDAKVSFDGSRNQIVIELQTRDPRYLPPGGPVNVSCYLEGGSEQTRGKLSGLLSASRPREKLFIDLAAPSAKPLRMYIDVDDYPRAFVFDVVCQPGNIIGEQTDLVELAMTSDSLRGILPASDEIPVSLKVNAPVGSFESQNDTIELGFDLNGDGAPDPESSVILDSDREVHIGIIKATADGKVTIDATATDHRVLLPSVRLENIDIQVAAEMEINEVNYKAAPIDLYIDTAAPVIGPVDKVSPSRPSIAGQETDLLVFGFDEAAGVQQIEAVFDKDGSGEFPEDAKPMIAVRQSSRQWVLSAKLPADLGPHTLLVRSTDAVGNTSEPYPVDLNVQAAVEGANPSELPFVELLGTIQLRGKAVPGAEITLIDLAPAKAPTTSAPIVAKADSAGLYKIAKLKPGSYSLMARGVVRNRVHLVEQTLTVPGTDPTNRHDIELP